jgi:hypothetical protein
VGHPSSLDRLVQDVDHNNSKAYLEEGTHSEEFRYNLEVGRMVKDNEGESNETMMDIHKEGHNVNLVDIPILEDFEVASSSPMVEVLPYILLDKVLEDKVHIQCSTERLDQDMASLPLVEHNQDFVGLDTMDNLDLGVCFVG